MLRSVKWFFRILLLALAGLLLWAVLLLSPLLVSVLSDKLLGDADWGWRIAHVVYSWPIAVVVLVLAFILVFRVPLTALIGRIISITRSRIEFAQEQRPLPQTDRDPRRGEISWEEWTQELVSRFSPTQKEILTQVGQAGRQLVLFWIERWWFEQIWNQVYGTQIDLLRRLVSESGSVNVAELHPFFQEHKRLVLSSEFAATPLGLSLRLDEKGYLEGYLSFLESTYLVTKEGDTIRATELAQRFLKYIGDQGYKKEWRIL